MCTTQRGDLMEKHWQENLCESFVWKASTSPATEALKIASESDLVAVLSQKFAASSPALDIENIHTGRPCSRKRRFRKGRGGEEGARFHFIFCHIVPVTEEEERRQARIAKGRMETEGQLDTSNLIEYWINMANTVTSVAC